MNSATTVCSRLEGCRSIRYRAPTKARHSERGTTMYPRTQAWEQGLVQGSDIDRSLGVVESLQRGERPSRVAELARVVVLHDPYPRVTRPREQLQPAWHGERDAERKLM